MARNIKCKNFNFEVFKLGQQRIQNSGFKIYTESLLMQVNWVRLKDLSNPLVSESSFIVSKDKDTFHTWK